MNRQGNRQGLVNILAASTILTGALISARPCTNFLKDHWRFKLFPKVISGYVVKEGDTYQKIAEKEGVTSEWSQMIYAEAMDLVRDSKSNYLTSGEVIEVIDANGNGKPGE